MNNWTKEQFCGELISYLTDKANGLAVETCRIMSVDGKDYTGLVLKKEEMDAAPVMNLSDAFRRYQEGESLDEIGDSIIANLETLPNMGAAARDLLDYEKVKNRLYIRVSNADWDKEVLEKVPHRVVADLALTCHIQVGKSASTMVTEKLLENYGITEDELFDDAIRNTVRLKPISIMNLDEAMRSLAGSLDVQADLDDPDKAGPEHFIKVVSNSEGINGAAALFYPGIMEQLQSMLGDFYVLPSSRHEVLIHPKNLGTSPSDLVAMVKEINREVVDRADRLSDHVYFYQAETGRLTLAAM